jgi:two-component system, chemotaxis family, protein-glutamate methylesterase/glutaminase
MRGRARNQPEWARRDAVVIGGSLGGQQALCSLLPQLPARYPLPVIVVLHRHRHAQDLPGRWLSEVCALPVCAVEDKSPIVPGQLYVCPANYHVLIEAGHTFALSIEPPVNFARPSIDVLFESAAQVYRQRLVGVLLSGASSDGAAGLAAIKARGGAVYCQDPRSALEPTMPEAGCGATRVDRVASAQSIGRELSEFSP